MNVRVGIHIQANEYTIYLFLTTYSCRVSPKDSINELDRILSSSSSVLGSKGFTEAWIRNIKRTIILRFLLLSYVEDTICFINVVHIVHISAFRDFPQGKKVEQYVQLQTGYFQGVYSSSTMLSPLVLLNSAWAIMHSSTHTHLPPLPLPFQFSQSILYCTICENGMNKK